MSSWLTPSQGLTGIPCACRPCSSWWWWSAVWPFTSSSHWSTMLPACSATLPPTPTGLWRDSSKTPSSIYCALLPLSSRSYQGLDVFLSVFLLWVCRHVSEETITMCADTWCVRHMLHRDNWSAWKSEAWVQPSSSWTIQLFSYITLDQSLYISYSFPIRKTFLSGAHRSLPVQICYIIVHGHNHNVVE